MICGISASPGLFFMKPVRFLRNAGERSSTPAAAARRSALRRGCPAPRHAACARPRWRARPRLYGARRARRSQAACPPTSGSTGIPAARRRRSIRTATLRTGQLPGTAGAVGERAQPALRKPAHGVLCRLLARADTEQRCGRDLRDDRTESADDGTEDAAVRGSDRVGCFRREPVDGLCVEGSLVDEAPRPVRQGAEFGDGGMVPAVVRLGDDVEHLKLYGTAEADDSQSGAL